MTTLYTRNGCIPTLLPEIIELSDKTVVIGSASYTDEQIADAGWTVAPTLPTYDYETQVADWNAETSQWDINPIPQEILDQRTEDGWRGIRHERGEILSQSDYMVIKATETGTAIPSEWLTYRQALRDITNQDDPFDITWPTKPE